MDTPDPLPALVAASVDAWLDALDRLAPGVVEGCYLVGSVALEYWRRDSDVDVVAFVADPTDADTVDRLRAAHTEYASNVELAVVDGPFLGWADVTSPPLAVQRPWTLDGEFRFDGECFEINPVTWFTLATYGVSVRGPAAAELGVFLDASDRRGWTRENVDTYWRGVLTQIDEALDADVHRDEYDAEMTEWCALGIARMAYTAQTGGVISKSGAGRWALDTYPDHHDVLECALAIRERADGTTVRRGTIEQVSALLGELVADVVA